jgi:Mg-chelatase subunit ChlD
MGVRGCLHKPATFVGIAVETDSLIVLYDKSASMEDYLAQVRDESKKLLEERRQRSGEQFADLIAYDQESASALDDLRPVTADSIKKIMDFMNSLIPGGRTNLAAGMDLAAEEVSRHGRKTTLLIFTDGEDKSIPEMLKDKDKVLAKFKGVPITVHAVTPRLLKPGADPRPVTTDEKTLRDFCEAFNGQFGPTKGGQ